jgi:hypothetical protein
MDNRRGTRVNIRTATKFWWENQNIRGTLGTRKSGKERSSKIDPKEIQCDVAVCIRLV